MARRRRRKNKLNKFKINYDTAISIVSKKVITPNDLKKIDQIKEHYNKQLNNM